MTSQTVKGCCPLDCQDSCSWVAQVENGRVVRVVGAPDHPITRGVLCAKVRDYETRLDAPDRLLHPLLRRGPKGRGLFQRITWDEAVSHIAERYGAIIAHHGGEALLPVNFAGSLGVVQRRALMRLFHALGASRFHGSVCGQSGNALAAEGHALGFDPEEVAESRLVLLWGTNLLTTAPHGWHFIKAARERHGARVICIDPRRTRTAAASDEHISIQPGSDAVLAAGLAHVALREGLANLNYAQAAASDFDAFCEQVAPWTPERVAGLCGIGSDAVVRLARELAGARPAVIRAGIAPQQTRRGEALVRLLSALSVLGGHPAQRGGGLLIETGPHFHDARVARPDLMSAPTRSFDMARLGETLTNEALSPPIKGLMIWGTNPAVTQPDTARVRQGLSREDLFTVVIEHVPTDTAAFADIVLPSTMQLEHFDVQGAWGHHYISVNHPAVAPRGEAKSHGGILRLLARRMGLTEPALQESDEEIAEAALPVGMELGALKERGWIKCSPVGFTPAPKVRLCVGDGVPLPAVAPSLGHLQLLTPKGLFFLNTTFADMPRHQQSAGRPTLEMSRGDAEMRGLSDGGMVEVRNTRGSICAHLTVVDAMQRGVVALPGKWWNMATARPWSAVNDLTTPAWSPAGQPAYNETFVEVLPLPSCSDRGS
ncbi:molybdopterin oxidoreductase family protein [Roseomonas nepalensis]|uniref:Molybdopterin oxidoreductase family protein n=1 Tax=Muricoccus nepalensis TaxID=1854500 RepID=A0A502FRT5_9PROT|nr:molybdopterin-dependent oxidoreductase [Roseomonas nepalensis]TPG52287.1 molybdopterin oxidoreductase family protein [Roseomonas nepalensis]